MKVKDEFANHIEQENETMTIEFWRWICGHHPELSEYFKVTIPETSLQEKIEQAIERSRDALEE